MTYHLGVDLGTTYTAAAIARDGRALTTTLGSRSVAIPSVVYLGGDELLVGEAAARRAVTEPGRVAREFKRRVGDSTPILLGGSPIGAELLMARMLQWVVKQVSTTEGSAPATLAVTHPANWGEYKLDLLRQAVRHVDLKVDHYVPEPVAAASFYADQRDLADGSVVAVYDLGGGTFDAALVRVEGNGFRIVGRPDGIERLGGIDFDHAILHHVSDTLGIDLDSPTLDTEDAATMSGLQQLRQDCVEAKEALSSESDVSIPVLLPNRHTEVRLTRQEFEAMIRPALNETIVALRRAVGSAGVGLDEVSAVLLVGGSSRIPMVGHLVSEQLGRPVAVDANPKDAISQGAALVAWRAARPAPPSAGSGAGSGNRRPAPPRPDPRPAPPAAAAVAAAAGPTGEQRPGVTQAGASGQRPAQTMAMPQQGFAQQGFAQQGFAQQGFAQQAPSGGGGSGPYGAAAPPAPAGGQNRNLVLAAAVLLVVVLGLVAILANQGGGDDDSANPGGGTTPTSPGGTDPEDPGTTDPETPDTTDSGNTSPVSLSALPGDDWGDEASAAWGPTCESLFASASEEVGGLDGNDIAGMCGCIYDEMSTSDVSLTEFNDFITSRSLDTSSPAFDAYNTANVDCALEAIPAG